MRAFSKAKSRGVQIGTSGRLLPRLDQRPLVWRQERDLRAFAKRAGRKIVGVFKETASGADNARPERAKVLALARAHEIDAILVTELSRWGRSPQDLVQRSTICTAGKLLASWLRRASASISAPRAAS